MIPPVRTKLAVLDDVSTTTPTDGQVLTFVSSTSLWTPATPSGGGGSGTVTSVALTMPTGFSVGGSPVTGTGTLAVTTSLSGVLKGTGSGIAAATAGTDYLTPSGNGSALTALSASALATGTVNTARLGTGTASSSTFLRGDGTWAAPAGGGGGDMLAANNLSDVASATTSRTNLGLGTSATHAAGDFALVASNLSDLASASTARANLGLGTSATHAATDFLLAASNLSDVASAATARNNILPTQSGHSGEFLTTNGTSASWGAAGGGGSSTSGTVFTQTADVTVSTNGVDTTLVGTGVGSLTIAANHLTVGKTYRIRAKGIFNGDAAGNIPLIKVNLGATLLGANIGSWGNANSTNAGWEMEFEFTCRATGASGSVMGQGRVITLGTVTSANTYSEFMANTSATTIDTTASHAIDVTGTFTVGSHSVTCTNLTVEELG